MQFSAEDIKKYQELCRRYFNQDVDEQTAVEELHSLVFLVGLLYRPSHHAELEELGQRLTSYESAKAKLPKSSTESGDRVINKP